MEISTGTGIVIFGMLYVLNTVFGAVWAFFMQTRRLASEERQAVVASKVEMKGTVDASMRKS